MSHPTGNPNVRGDLRALERAGCLAAFYTTIAVSPDFAQSTAWPASFRRELARRTFGELPQGKVVTSPGRELCRLAARTAGLHRLTRHDIGWASWDAVYRSLDRRLARDLKTRRIQASGVYAYEDGALQSLTAARRLGLASVYHLASAYWRCRSQILEEERDRRPEWAITMEGLTDSPAKHRRKDLELAQADCVIVASSFTRRSLSCCPQPPQRIEVVSYGAPAPFENARASSGARRPLRALFVGYLSQLKGLADLSEAMEHVRHQVTLTLVGPRTSQNCPAVDHMIRRHSWIPAVPNARVLELMAEHDVLVFPALAEGFGLVITEALSRGLPVITTPNTGGPDIMVDGREGFIVPIRDPDAIADRLTRLAEDRDLRAAMSQAALETARRHPWQSYEERIVQIVAEAVRARTASREAA